MTILQEDNNLRSTGEGQPLQMSPYLLTLMMELPSAMVVGASVLAMLLK